MNDDAELRTLNLQISGKEDQADRKVVVRDSRPEACFSTADDQRTIDDALAYLDKLTEGGQREQEVIESIQIFGERESLYARSV
jgi:hypothetical protein